ncbi:hypothetical protein [Capnocytophaga sp.]|uniref:hypothetical protein n=1 Tax=Capnocytophaga sp. TaxID=44737 RepID=UPI0026DBDD7B|nr:hypothetical protein [Capnocytophaga sp.]MDO5106599.1 hypothetical protein [Capnocytophaga sp.]
MTKRRINSVNDLEAGKCYRQGKGVYFRFEGKSLCDEVVGSLVCIDKNSVLVEYRQELAWVFDTGEVIEEISDEKFLKACGKAMKQMSKIANKVADDMSFDIAKDL